MADKHAAHVLPRQVSTSGRVVEVAVLEPQITRSCGRSIVGELAEREEHAKSVVAARRCAEIEREEAVREGGDAAVVTAGKGHSSAREAREGREGHTDKGGCSVCKQRRLSNAKALKGDAASAGRVARSDKPAADNDSSRGRGEAENSAGLDRECSATKNVSSRAYNVRAACSEKSRVHGHVSIYVET